MAESVSDLRITTDTPYLSLMSELWGVYCEDFGENWPRYNGIQLYITQYPFQTEMAVIHSYSISLLNLDYPCLLLNMHSQKEP